MNPKSKPNRKLLAVLATVLIVSGGIPFVAGTHVNEILTPWREVPEEPTGVGLLDAAIQQASGVLDREVAPQRAEPQVPATFYHDWFPADPMDRIGGWEDWDEGVDWDLDDGAAGQEVAVPWVTPAGNQELQTHERSVEQGYRFGGTDGYLGRSLEGDGGGPSRLVSPLISLRSLPVNADDADDEESICNPGESQVFPLGVIVRVIEDSICVSSGGVDDEGAVDLTALADQLGVSINNFPLERPASNLCSIWPDCDQEGSIPSGPVDLAWEAAKDAEMEFGRPQFDGNVDFLDRVLLYMDHRFNLAQGQDSDFDGVRVGVVPEGESMESTVFLPSLRSDQGSDADGATVYMGAQLNFTEEAFDLTRWAGQDVRLVFQVEREGDLNRSIEGARQALFEDQGCDPVCGWDLSNIRVEGPAYKHNVRIDRILYPVQDDEGYLARPGDAPFQILMLNRGSVTEDVEVRMAWPRQGAVGSDSCTVTVEGFRPGDAVPVKFSQETGEECDRIDIEEGQVYNVTFTAHLLGSSQDLYDNDNTRSITVTGDGPDIRIESMTLSQDRASSPGQPIDVRAMLANRAITDGRADAHLRIDYLGPEDAGWIEEQQGNVNLVGEAGQETQSGVAVPQRSGGIPVDWTFTPQQVGCYRVFVHVTDPATGEVLGGVHDSIVGVRMAPEESCGSEFDLDVAAVSLETDYDWMDVGFGPGTRATANVTITNTGTYNVGQANLSLAVQDEHATQTWYHNVTLDSGFTVGPGEEVHEEIEFALPSQQGRYRFAVGVELVGDLIPGVSLEDKDASNDCRSMSTGKTGDRWSFSTTPLESASGQSDFCPLDDVGGFFRLESNPRMDIDFRVFPEAGQAGSEFPREFELDVINTGNVVVEGACLALRIDHAQSDWAQNPSWIIHRSPLPGHTAAWEDLDLRNPEDPDQALQALSQLRLLEDGMYFVRAFLYLEAGQLDHDCPPDPAERVTEDQVLQMRLDAFDTIYSDTFEPQGVGMDFPDLVNGTGMIPRDEAWTRVQGLVPDEHGDLRETTLWQFGDPESGQYPDEANASLELPPLDLSSARLARFALMHNYDLEAGYDGARLEASTDQGQTWFPLKPRQGYPGTVAADSPLNPERDPTVDTPAWTGSSRDRSDDGWVIDEFDLALPQFTTPIQLMRFDQQGMEDGPHGDNPLLSRHAGLSWDTRWGTGNSCPDGQQPRDECWYRENVNWHNPLPLCDPEAHPGGRLPSDLVKYVCEGRPRDLDDEAHQYWWSGHWPGIVTVHDRNGGGTVLSFDLSFEEGDIGEDEEVRVTFWYWKDEGGVLFAGELPESSHQGAVPPPPNRFAREAGTGGWARGEFVVGDVHDRLQEGGPLTVTIRSIYADHQLWDRSNNLGVQQSPHNEGKTLRPTTLADREDSNRGAAMDAVTVEVVGRDGAVLSRNQVAEGDMDVSLVHADLVAPTTKFEGTILARDECNLPNPHQGEGQAQEWGQCHRIVWNATEELNGAEDFGWSRVDKAGITREGACRENDVACEAWGVREEHTRRGEIAPVWQFGVEITDEEGESTYAYPTNAHQRLVTPRVDLSGVAGGSATLTFWELYDLMRDLGDYDNAYNADASGNNERNILVQVVETTPDGSERLRDWEPLDYDREFVKDRTTREGDRDGCTSDVPAWCPARVDVSPYIGEVVRFAFDIQTTRTPWEVVDEEVPKGWTWLLDEVGVEAESMTGEPVQLRLRAGTDKSINPGHWMVQNLQLVGKLYEDNVAIVPDEPLQGVYGRGLGEVLRFNGTVRNLGPSMDRSTNLEFDVNIVPLVEADALEETPVPEVVFLRDERGERTDPLENRSIGPINLNRVGDVNLAGARTDRIPYALEIALPEDAFRDLEYRVTLRILDGQGRILFDDNRGDHERAFNIKVDTRPGALEGNLRVHPPTVATGERVDFEFALENPGPTSITDNGVAVVATRISDGKNTTIRDDLPLGLPPESSGALTWDWRPQEAGFYRIEATVNGDPFYTHVMVGEKPLYHLESFIDDPFADDLGWTTECGATNCWRHVTQFTGSDGGIFIGNEQANVWAQMPWQDLSFLAKAANEGESAIVRGESRFSPFISVNYQSILDAGHSVEVQGAHRSHGGGDEVDFRGLQTRDTHSGRTGEAGLTGLDDRNWRLASFPLFHKDNSVLGPNNKALLGDNEVSFRFHADWLEGDAQGLVIDRVSISSYNAEVAPERHEITLRPGADKTFYFDVQNTGAATDTYEVRLNVPRLFQAFLDESGASIEVPEPSRVLTLEPGKSGRVPVDITIPFERLGDQFDQQILVEVVSTNDPNRAATGLFHITEYIQDDLPDLVMELGRPAGENGPVGEGEQANFALSVTNDGSEASRETDAVLFACPKKYTNEDNEEVEVESIGHCGELELAKNLGEMRLPPLLPSQDMQEGQADDVWSTTVTWIPEVLLDRGDYWIVAVADPFGKVPQFSRDSSVDELDLTVAPFEQPDLQVTDLSVTDANGDPVTSAFAGDVLNVEGTVRNDGDAPAPNVRVRILNQFALRDERIGDLNPGGTHTMSAQWIAQPGNWVLRFEASTGVVEATTENNAKAWSLAIRSGTLEAQWEPEIMHLEPGQSMQGNLHIHNRRDAALNLALRTAVGDVNVSGLPGALDIDRGASKQLPFRLTVSPFAQAGPQTVDVELVQQETGTPLTASTLEVHVAADRKLRLAAEPLHVSPGSTHWPLVFQNDGNAAESFTIRLDPPDLWGATPVPSSLRLDAGSTGSVQTILEIPPGTPPGEYPIRVEAGDMLRETVDVRVVAQPVWRTEVVAVHGHREPAEVLVRVENTGNQRATAPFLMEASGESVYSVHPMPSPQEPGESRSYRLSVSASELASLVLPGKDTPMPLMATGKVPPVEAVRLDVESRGTITAGDLVDFRFSVKNLDEDAQPGLQVSLWADGRLSAEETVDLETGENRDVTFTWQAMDAGPRVVTATVGSGEESVARTVVLDVQPAESRLAIPGAEPGLFLLVMILVAAVVPRRWRP